ncbi:hypothetical protein SEA_ANNADREAMY_250 [Streptomyces phage Annadreamy]|uniref:Uncharacterized protein n=2 Tax=Annadreamyvirus annadreamy TaxID=2846392 RepID=A0A345GTQ7_9CAUD|nr:hypothetical protein HWB75_gp029 [Streptomyces phage Annadreamy]AXG66329.1 hypothetical protein SEA_ANNADREAMY_250 [Streptomyces phage Annadreamy]QGH79557.1 hypothetical protein SEA_LIMPID_256 [Streptomyces phage Limpid]
MAVLTYTVGRLRRKEFRATLSEFSMREKIDQYEEVKGFFDSRFVVDASIDNHVEIIKSLGVNLTE